MQLRYRRHHRPAEGNQPVAAQNEAADMTVLAVVRVIKAEGALETEPSVLLPADTQANRMNAMVQPLHAGDATGITSQRLGAFGSGAAGVPERERCRRHDHQED